MDYVEVAVTVRPQDADAVADRLVVAGFPGLVLGEFGPDGGAALTEATLKIYLPDVQAAERMDAVEEALTGIPFRLAHRVVREEDWAESWKQYWHVQHVGARIVIRPSWEEYDPAPGEVVIVLDPKQAFGTGTHGTTRLCLQAIERLVRPGDTVFDVGAGSGILAIGGLLLGASSAIGVDTDPVAVEAALENAEINRVADQCEWRLGSASDLKGAANLVVANILAEVIVHIAPDLARLTGRDLVVSGIITRKAEDTRIALTAQGLHIVRQDLEGEWVAPTFSAREIPGNMK